MVYPQGAFFSKFESLHLQRSFTIPDYFATSFDVERFSSVGSMVDEAPSANEQEDLQVMPRRRRLCNRITYLALLSFLGPFLNFAYNWKETKDMGITLSLMLWVMFGGFWCAGFATIMGPLFAACSVVIRFLDVIPALGSSIWVCVSTFVMVAVINDPFPAFLHNLPLFSLMFANGFIFLSELSQDDRFWEYAPSSSRDTLDTTGRSSDYTGFREPGYYWQDGNLCCGSYNRSSPSQPLYVVKPLSLPEGASQSCQNLRDNGYIYLSGHQLEKFAEDFEIWKGHTQRFASVIALRRAFCFVGFLLEAAAVVCTVAVLGSLSGSGASSMMSHGTAAQPASHPEPSVEAVSTTVIVVMRKSFIMSPLDFSILQTVICVLLLIFSDYLLTMVHMRFSFTTVPEVRASMARCLSSRFFDWSGPRSGYLANGRRIRGPGQIHEYEMMPVKELPTLGIIKDQAESELADNVVLKSIIPSQLLFLIRIEESLVAVRIFDPDSDRESLLRGEREKVEIREQDMVI